MAPDKDNSLLGTPSYIILLSYKTYYLYKLDCIQITIYMLSWKNHFLMEKFTFRISFVFKLWGFLDCFVIFFFWRWKMIDYYISRVQGNLQLLEQLDLIGRTSEMARLFGIQFLHVLTRGSQVKISLNFVNTTPHVYSLFIWGKIWEIKVGYSSKEDGLTRRFFLSLGLKAGLR